MTTIRYFGHNRSILGKQECDYLIEFTSWAAVLEKFNDPFAHKLFSTFVLQTGAFYIRWIIVQTVSSAHQTKTRPDGTPFYMFVRVKIVINIYCFQNLCVQPPIHSN